MTEQWKERNERIKQVAVDYLEMVLDRLERIIGEEETRMDVIIDAAASYISARENNDIIRFAHIDFEPYNRRYRTILSKLEIKK